MEERVIYEDRTVEPIERAAHREVAGPASALVAGAMGMCNGDLEVATRLLAAALAQVVARQGLPIEDAVTFTTHHFELARSFLEEQAVLDRRTADA